MKDEDALKKLVEIAETIKARAYDGAFAVDEILECAANEIRYLREDLIRSRQPAGIFIEGSQLLRRKPPSKGLRAVTP